VDRYKQKFKTFKYTTVPVIVKTSVTASSSSPPPAQKPIVILNKCPRSPPVEPLQRSSRRHQKMEEIPTDNNSSYEVFYVTATANAAPDEPFEEACSDYSDDDDYKPPVPTTKRKRKQKPKVIAKQQKRSAPEKTDASEDFYFKTVADNIIEHDENGERKIFQCSYDGCSDRFSRRQYCKTHFYQHIIAPKEGQKHDCQYCKKTFKVASALERHERVCNYNSATSSFANINESSYRCILWKNRFPVLSKNADVHFHKKKC